MEINLEKFKSILDEGMDLNFFYVLYATDRKESLDHMKWKGMINVLKLKRFIDGRGNVTEKGKALLNKINPPIEKKEVDANTWIQELHKKLQDKLAKLTGKKQKIISGKYSFLPNAVDLGTKLFKVLTKYKIDDLDKVEKVLLQYLDKCNKAKWEMVVLMEYYILKNEVSRFMTDFENFQEVEDVEVEVKEIYTVKPTKNLF
jgi:hypothetical protein